MTIQLEFEETKKTRKRRKRRDVVQEESPVRNEVVRSSSRRAEASRENGKKGGVKTKEGKLISSQNARKHGILANHLTEYDQVQYKDLYRVLEQEFYVRTKSQEILLEQLIICYIKLGRCSRFEAEIIREAVNRDETIEDVLRGLDEGVKEEHRPLIDESTIKRMELVLTRYEPQLINRLIGLMNVLEKHKKRVLEDERKNGPRIIM